MFQGLDENSMKKEIWILAIDPGLSGAFVLFNGRTLKTWPMPITKNGKDKEIKFGDVVKILKEVKHKFGKFHVYLERAVSFGMGTKSAFNYGRGFAALEIAIEVEGCPVTYVEPGKWTKAMHEGISGDLKGKVKSLIAVKRLYPRLVGALPANTKGDLLDGPVDALLIAGYALRSSTVKKEPESDDFY
jgi:hypothetical protein